MIENHPQEYDGFEPSFMNGSFCVTEEEMELHHKAVNRFLNARDMAGKPTMLLIRHNDSCLLSALFTHDSFVKIFGQDVASKVSEAIRHNNGHPVIFTVAASDDEIV